MTIIDKDKNSKDALKKIGKRLISILNFLFYNNIPLSTAMENAQLFQKDPFTLPRKSLILNIVSQDYFKAVKFGEYDRVKEFLELDKRYLYQYDYFFETGYHWAAKRGHKKILELLLAKGDHYNFFDMKNRTPLHMAAQNNNFEILELLIATRKSNPFLKSKEGKKPFDLATDLKCRSLLKEYEEVNDFNYLESYIF
jgi:ankyrin repeat protein